MLAQLRRNLALLYIAELAGKLLGLAVFGYLTRALLLERYGNLEFALGILFLLNLVIDAGLGHYGAREAAKRPERTDELVSQIAVVRGGLIVLSLLVLAGVAWRMPLDGVARAVIVLQGLVLLPAPFVLTWVFQAQDRMHVVAGANLLRQVVLAAGVLYFVRRPEHVVLVPAWDAIGLGVAVVLQVVLYRRSGGAIHPLRYLAGLKTVVVESAPLAGSSVVWAVRLFAPLLALGVFRTQEDVGLFGAGHRIVIAVHTFVWLYYFNILPTLSRLGTEPGLARFRRFFGRSMRLIGWVALWGAAVGSFLAPVLIPTIYGAELVPAVGPFAVMVWVLAAAFVSGHHRFSLIALSLQREEFVASAAGAIVSVGACLVLGAELTPLAAAWIFVVAEVTTLVFAAGLLFRAVPTLAPLPGLTLPAVVTAIGAAGAWAVLAAAPIPAAAALTALFAVAVFFFDRDGLRELIAMRGGAKTETAGETRLPRAGP